MLRRSPNKLVTVATFDGVEEAHICKGKLQAEGVPCFLADEHVISVIRYYSWALGGVKLKVRESDAAKAAAILGINQNGSAQLAKSISENCPRCNSTDIWREPLFDLFLPLLVSLIFLMLTELPRPLLGRRRYCKRCDYEWRKRALLGGCPGNKSEQWAKGNR